MNFRIKVFSIINLALSSSSKFKYKKGTGLPNQTGQPGEVGAQSSGIEGADIVFKRYIIFRTARK